MYNVILIGKQGVKMMTSFKVNILGAKGIAHIWDGRFPKPRSLTMLNGHPVRYINWNNKKRTPRPKAKTWKVKSGTRDTYYVVSLFAGKWRCTCMGFKFHGHC